MSDGAPIILMGMAPCWDLPSASPFCMKLETWLRMADIPYEAKVISGPPKSKTGKVPYIIQPDGSFLEDTGKIIESLRASRGVDLDKGLSDADRVLRHLLRRTLEESLYFAMVWTRWGDDKAWSSTKAAYFAHAPAPMRALVPPIIRRQVKRDLHGQGLGRRDEAEIIAHGVEDLQALAAILGDKDYFLGDPSSIDATAYAWLENLRLPPDPVGGLLKEALLTFDNLIAYCDRMRGRYWA